jgi:hypothetical protein
LPQGGRTFNKEAFVPSPLFNFLFLVALFVPAAMYIGGVLILIASLVLHHWRAAHPRAQMTEAHAH